MTCQSGGVRPYGVMLSLRCQVNSSRDARAMDGRGLLGETYRIRAGYAMKCDAVIHARE